MFFNKSKKKINTTEIVDEIQNTVESRILKNNGFKKYGRTYNRVVDGDIVQVINFQNGCPAKRVTGFLRVNIGIRVPERVERSFVPEESKKRHYKEYECDIRMTLGEISRSKSEYDLYGNPQKIAEDIIKRIDKYVFPMLSMLDTRDKILENESKYDYCNMFSHLRDLHNVMIFGRRGDMEKATELYKRYYAMAVKEFQKEKKINRKKILGTTAYYKPNPAHIEYLNKLADELGLVIEKFEVK